MMPRRLFIACLLLMTVPVHAVTLQDDEGHTVKLSAPAQRIVSLAPHVTELLFAAGAGARVVGVSEYSDYPPAAKSLPRVGSSSAIDLERLLALRPDVVVAWRLEATARALDRLPALGVPVFYSEPHRLSEIPDAIEALGRLAGTQKAANDVAGELRARLARLHARYAGRKEITVFYQIAERPLMTVNGRQFISDALGVCGAVNIFAHAPVIAPVVSVEEVLAADPDAIVAAPSDPSDRSWEAAWRRFTRLRAVRDASLVTVRRDDMHRHGPRAFAATERLCSLLDAVRTRSGRQSREPTLTKTPRRGVL